MTILECGYGSESLGGIRILSGRPSDVSPNSAPTTLSIWPGFHDFNSYSLPAAPETSIVNWSLEGDHVCERMRSPRLVLPSGGRLAGALSPKSFRTKIRSKFLPGCREKFTTTC